MTEFHLEVWAMAGGRWGWQMRFGVVSHKGTAVSREAAWERAFNARAFALFVLSLRPEMPAT